MTKYIYWPEDYRQGDFVIAVLGEADITSYLKELSKTKKIDGRKIVVRELNSYKDVRELDQIVWVGKSSMNQFSLLRNKLNKSSSLLITESPGSIGRGTMINFIERGNRVQFELDLTEFKKKKIKVSNDLIELASRVRK